MTKSFEIYFHNLNDQAQKEYLAFQGVSDPSELNEEIIAIVDKEEPEGQEKR